MENEEYSELAITGENKVTSDNKISGLAPIIFEQLDGLKKQIGRASCRERV